MSDIQEKKFDEVCCATCGKIIKAQAELCPFCGVRQTKKYPQKICVLLECYGTMAIPQQWRDYRRFHAFCRILQIPQNP